MKLNNNLNLVLPLTNGWVHSMPVSYSVFEKYFLPISKSFAQVYGEGLGSLAGPRVSYMMLKKVSIELGEWDGAEGVENGLMNEIYRLSNAIIPGDKGWKTMPLYEVFQQNLLDEEEQAEVKNALVFFILVSCMHKRAERLVALTLMSKLWGGQITSSSCTEYVDSLPTSTPEDNSGKTGTQLSIPS